MRFRLDPSGNGKTPTVDGVSCEWHDATVCSIAGSCWIASVSVEGKLTDTFEGDTRGAAIDWCLAEIARRTGKTVSAECHHGSLRRQCETCELANERDYYQARCLTAAALFERDPSIDVAAMLRAPVTP